MEIRIKVCDLIDMGVWAEYCELTGTNEWAVNEGLVNSDEVLTLTEKQARELGVIK